MAFSQLNLGLALTIPTPGTKNWAQTLLQTTWTKISAHGHTGKGDGNQIGTAALANLAVTQEKLARNLGLTPALAPLQPVATSQEVDFALGSTLLLDLTASTGDVTVSFKNAVAGVPYRLFVKQAPVPRDLLWPASVLWPQGQKLILSSDPGAVDVVQLYFDGTKFFATWQNDFK